MALDPATATSAYNWVSLVLAVGALIVQGLWTLAVFMWSRGSTTQKLTNRFATLSDEVTRLRLAQERASSRGSETQGRNTATFGKVQVDLAVLCERMEQSERDRVELWNAIERRTHKRQ